LCLPSLSNFALLAPRPAPAHCTPWLPGRLESKRQPRIRSHAEVKHIPRPQTHGMPDSPLAPNPAGRQAGKQTGTYHSFSLARALSHSPGKAFTNGTPESPCRATAPSIGIEKLLTMPHISTSRCLCPCPKTYCLAPNKSLSSPIASSDREYFAGACVSKINSPVGAGNDGLHRSQSGFAHCKFECVAARCATPAAIISRIVDFEGQITRATYQQKQ
jgi:hypothetical protein